jgi:hypothetical protein
MPNLDIQTMVLIIVIMVFGLAMLSAYDKKDKIYCTFRRRDKTLVEKWAKSSRGLIDFEGGWYRVIPKRCMLMFWNKGIHGFIPIWVRRLDYRYDSNMPIDPETFNAAYDNPADQKALDRTEDLTSLLRTQERVIGKQKQSGLSGWLPIIVILGFIVVGYMVYMQQQKTDMLGQAINVLQEMMMKAGLNK